MNRFMSSFAWFIKENVYTECVIHVKNVSHYCKIVEIDYNAESLTRNPEFRRSLAGGNLVLSAANISQRISKAVKEFRK